MSLHGFGPPRPQTSWGNGLSGSRLILGCGVWCTPSEVFGPQARVLRNPGQHPGAQFLSGTASPCSRRSASTRRARACTLAIACVAVTP
jgi:hypothetical protein